MFYLKSPHVTFQRGERRTLSFTVTIAASVCPIGACVGTPPKAASWMTFKIYSFYSLGGKWLTEKILKKNVFPRARMKL